MSFSENFINIMDAIGKKLGIVIDWSNNNILPYVEQLCTRIVNYEKFTSIAWLIFAIIILIVGIVLFKKALENLKDNDYYHYDDTGIISSLIGSVLIMISIVCIIIQVGDIITCLTLPEKAIIEFIMRYNN